MPQVKVSKKMGPLCFAQCLLDYLHEYDRHESNIEIVRLARTIVRELMLSNRHILFSTIDPRIQQGIRLRVSTLVLEAVTGQWSEAALRLKIEDLSKVIVEENRLKRHIR